MDTRVETVETAKIVMHYRALFIFCLGVVCAGCASESKPFRDAHESIIHENHFASELEYKRRAEEIRKNGSYGVFQLAERCGKASFGDLTFHHHCEYDILIRLKLQCEIPQGTGMSFLQPMRSKEIVISLSDVSSESIKDKNRFPTKLTTTQDGEVEFSFTTVETLTSFVIDLKTSKGSLRIDRVRISDAVSVPEVFCRK